MTQEELDAMEDVTHLQVALFQGPDDGVVIDQDGREWMVGWLKGDRVKRLMRV